MKTNNNSPADKQAAKTDTPNALISDNDLLKFFNLERENVQDFSITRRKDGMYVNITLNKTWVQCPVCGHMTSRVKDYTDKKITHSVLSITNCYIIYHARRYECPHCKKTFYENNPFTFGGRLSVATVFNVLRDLKAPNATFTDVARRYGISATSVINIFDKHVHISRRQLPECLALDEVYAFKSHDSDYVCVIMDYLDKKIVDVLPSRRKYALLNYFMLIPLEERKKVKYVSFDMWETYRIVVKHVFPDACCITDHFHVIQELTRRVDRVRIRVQNRFRKTINTLKPKKNNKTITFTLDIVEANDENSIIGEASDYIKALLKLLPTEYATPLYMSDIEGTDQKIIAENLGLTLTNTKTRIQRARIKLKERFLECCVVSFGENGEMVSFDIKPQCTELQAEKNKFERSL